ncbi:MAG: DUF6504 family protein [Candidatus Eremiobacteraeota bacterium]|nr:DUF6504 family protein [Candidatus Eremiobacteraeota bacterium]
MAQFFSEALTASAECVDTGALSRGEPPLPKEFGWRGERLVVRDVVRTWRSTNTDRGDTYLARHWFELALNDGRAAVLYFDRKSRRDQPRWWLYTLTDEPA